MDAITAEKLAANAYRTLGLSASATQAEIEAAARKMRIWPDPSRVPPTSWDLPEVGPLRRSKPDIEQAVSALHQPQSRLEHRIFWYFGSEPPGSKLTGQGTNIVDRHAVALRGLQVAWRRTEENPALVNWGSVVDRIQHVLGSEDLLNRQVEIESAGQFDKPATDREIAQQLSSAASAVAAGVVRVAMKALDEGRLEIVGEIAMAIAAIPASATEPHPHYRLLDQLEDQFNIRADRMEQGLRRNLRTNRQNPDPFFRANLQHANYAADRYEKEVSPATSVLLSAAANDPDRLDRLKQRNAQLLILLAMGWEWAGEYELSAQQLKQALSIATGTISEYNVKREMQRLAEVRIQRRAAVSKRVAGKSQPKKKKSVGLYLVLLLVSSLTRVLIHSSNSNSSDSPTYDGQTSGSPLWNRQMQSQVDRIMRANQPQNDPTRFVPQPWTPSSPQIKVDPSKDLFPQPQSPANQFPSTNIPIEIDPPKPNPGVGFPITPEIPGGTWPALPPSISPIQPPTTFPPPGTGSSFPGGGPHGHRN